MKKVLSIITCGLLAACSCSDNQWEEVDNVTFEDTVYEAPVVEEPVVKEVQPKVVYNPAPVSNCGCQVQPCCQPVYQPCGCQPVVQPQPQPKITTTKKIITTTTTVEEPCGKPVCEPVVTTHEEIIPAEVSYGDYARQTAPVAAPDYVEVTVEKNPYHSQVVDMRSSNSKVEAGVAAQYSPEAYTVVATRASNRMLQDTSAIYDTDTTKTIYVKDVKLLSSDLPYGSHRLKGVTKDIISGSQTYEVVNNINSADFVLDTSADWFVAPNAAPALQYKMALFDRNGKKLNEWVEIIRQVQE